MKVDICKGGEFNAVYISIQGIQCVPGRKQRNSSFPQHRNSLSVSILQLSAQLSQLPKALVSRIGSTPSLLDVAARMHPGVHLATSFPPYAHLFLKLHISPFLVEKSA